MIYVIQKLIPPAINRMMLLIVNATSSVSCRPLLDADFSGRCYSPMLQAVVRDRCYYSLLQTAVPISEFYSNLTHFYDKINIFNLIIINGKIVLVLYFVYPMFPVYLDCPFLIAPYSVFSNVY